MAATASAALALAALLGSCAGYVSHLHRAFDEHDRRARAQAAGRGDERGGARRRPPGARVDSRTAPELRPGTARAYRPADGSAGRVKAGDLADSGAGGSLWVGTGGRGGGDHLFARSHVRSRGDIVLVNVHARLKNEITRELGLAFPPPRKRKGGKEAPREPAAEDGAGEDPGPGGAAAAAPGPGGEGGRGGKVLDRLPAVIVDRVNRNHFLIKGRKRLLHRSRRRAVELQALVDDRSIGDDDAVHSDDLLDVSVRAVLP